MHGHMNVKLAERIYDRGYEIKLIMGREGG